MLIAEVRARRRTPSFLGAPRMLVWPQRSWSKMLSHAGKTDGMGLPLDAALSREGVPGGLRSARSKAATHTDRAPSRSSHQLRSTRHFSGGNSGEPDGG